MYVDFINNDGKHIYVYGDHKIIVEDGHKKIEVPTFEEGEELAEDKGYKRVV